jgi:hypothetical protein
MFFLQLLDFVVIRVLHIAAVVATLAVTGVPTIGVDESPKVFGSVPLQAGADSDERYGP